MKRKLLLSLFLLPLFGIGQHLNVAGTLMDTVAKKAVPYAVIMAINRSSVNELCQTRC